MPSGGLETDGCDSYSYDSFDRLTSTGPIATTPPTSCATGSSSGTVTNEYDGLDRQTRVTTTGTTTGNEVRQLHYLGTGTTIDSQDTDNTTGTYQWGARTYNPTTATWLTPDTNRAGTAATNQSVGTDPLTENTYTYVNGDPINLNDPTGHMPCEDGVCGSIKFIESPAGQAAVNAQAQGEQQALAQLAQQAQLAQSDYPGSRIVNGNQQIQLSNGAVIGVSPALSVAQNSAAVDGQHFGAQLLQQQISECMYDAGLLRIRFRHGNDKH